MDAVAVGVAKPEEFPRRMWVGCGLSWLGLGWVGSMSPWPGTSCYKNTDTATAAEIQIRVDLAGLNRHGMRSGWLVAWCVGRKKKNTFGIMKYDVTREPSAETQINVGAKIKTEI